jgi:hypothetical protein
LTPDHGPTAPSLGADEDQEQKRQRTPNLYGCPQNG